ncbi:hypothetical protein Y032_0012g1858 [Ancylostoma ceylanicum]|uniref:Uncharacterized protein n=1 Tax=Ancylostoma ceylanicum TaxID=53326 RepID=A0A016VF63_9BILA|nr:hypothetical protein Y032_0012g1858 [Ancylostoma ceylanicum]
MSRSHFALKVGVFDGVFGFQVHHWNQRVEKNWIPLTSQYPERPDTLPSSSVRVGIHSTLFAFPTLSKSGAKHTQHTHEVPINKK